MFCVILLSFLIRFLVFFFFKQKTAYEIRISDWSSDVCSSDLGDNDGAAEALLEIIRRDREWNDGAARTQLLKLFEVVGLEDPWVSSQRRRLSAILFG